MDAVTTSLEALIQRAINSQNQQLDTAATDAFCTMVTKEVEGVPIASKLLISRIQSTIEWQALQALTLLDFCMKRCGPTFHAEIGKFRFLNEMIKLVSPKYLGNITPTSIKEKILSMLKAWAVTYPHEVKIKEAYEMLKKQGVVKDYRNVMNNSSDIMSYSTKIKNPIFDDEEKSKLLQKLLQSKNPDDLQAANKLIKTMFKEDEKRTQEDLRRVTELESINSNIKLLSEMLDSYVPSESSKEDVELIKDLYQACERLHPTIARLAQEAQDNEDILVRVIEANDNLEKVCTKYARLLLLKRPLTSSKSNASSRQMLLDLSSSEVSRSSIDSSNLEKDINLMSNPQSNIELLGDIFGGLICSTDELIHDSCKLPETSNISMSNTQPINIESNNIKGQVSKVNAVDDLDKSGEYLLKKDLEDSFFNEQLTGKDNNTSIVPVNRLLKPFEIEIPMKKNDQIEKKEIKNNDTLININNCSTSNPDDSDLIKVNRSDNENIIKSSHKLLNIENNFEVKSLSDINVNLEKITPGTIAPITVFEEKKGITVTFYFAKDSPRPDVLVIVVTTINKNCKPLTDYLFQAVVPKKCKCRLQFPSGTDLPPYKPFLPLSAITQIMLIANPYKEAISLKFMISYTMDGETITEMGEIDELPVK